MNKFHQWSRSLGLVTATVALLAALGSSASVAQADWGAGPNLVFTTLTLQNGWTGGPFSTAIPAVAKAGGRVIFKGAMSTSGTNPVAFTLPAGDRPHTAVYISVDLCNANYGRLFIDTNGVATVQTQTFSNAQCFTSLDGASFAL